MDVWATLLLGLVQGLTEFLPVSSSGHLVIVSGLVRFAAQSLSLDALLHLGTLLALVAFFAPRIGQLAASLVQPRARAADFRLLLFIALGSVPALIAGLAFESRLAAVFQRPVWAAGFLLVTAGLLLATRWARGARTVLDWRDALIIGTAQAVALLPGISRSGATLAAGLLLGFAPAVAFEFAMLLSVPAVFGAVLLSWPAGYRLTPLTAGAVLVAFGAGLAALWIVRRVLVHRGLAWFALYCALVGAAALVWFLH